MTKSVYCSSLKKLRLSHGYTQSDVSLILGIRQEQYSKYESGVTQLPISLLIRICKLYRVSSDSILNIHF